MKQSEADTLKGMIDLMTGSPAYDCIKSQANIIKAKNEQIEHLKHELANADVGHSIMADEIQKLKETKEHYEAVIDELKERLIIEKESSENLIGKLKEKIDKLDPEVERGCYNCGLNECSVLTMHECVTNNGSLWEPIK